MSGGMRNMEKRVNIVGSGLSGLYLAINLAKEGISSNLISIMPSERAQSVLAEGGINCVFNDKQGDSITSHIEDTYQAGLCLENIQNIQNLCQNSPKIVKNLISLGVPFNYENGEIAVRAFGGQSHKRTLFAKTSTGKMIVTSLINEVRKYEVNGLINRLPHHECIDVEIKDNKLLSIIIRDTYSNKCYSLTGKTIFASGGLNGFFEGSVTGSNLNNANIQAKLFAKGVMFRNLEFIQYHPTTIDVLYKRILVSESARGEGARLLTFKNKERYYFMEDRHPLGNLAPRDVISKEEYLILHDPECDGIYLDFSSISKKTWEERLSDLRKEIKDYLRLDPMNELIPVKPGIHFFMGGIKVDGNHKTNIENLYAVGETASMYHGANRLGGNSLLAALYSGLKAHETLIKEDDYPIVTMKEIEPREILNIDKFNQELRDILLKSMNIIRNEEGLKEGLDAINNILSKDNLSTLEHDRATFAKAIITSAYCRLESRGAHQRSDYPETSLKYQRPSFIKYSDDKIDLKYNEE